MSTISVHDNDHISVRKCKTDDLEVNLVEDDVGLSDNVVAVERRDAMAAVRVRR